jgi:hypothetical protein
MLFGLTSVSAQYNVKTWGATQFIDCDHVSFVGSVNTNGDTVYGAFDYGLSTHYDKSVAAVPQPVISDSDYFVSSTYTPVQQGMTYHFRLMVSSVKTGPMYGNDMTYTTCTGATSVNTLAAEGMSVYPNPVTDRMTIDAGAKSATLRFSIFGQDGKSVKLPQSKVGDKFLISTALLPAGTYWLQLAFGNRIIVVPFEKLP